MNTPDIRITIFAEGSKYQDPKRGRDSFERLWRLLLNKCGISNEQIVEVNGFSKDQLVALCPPAKFHGFRNLRLDYEIERAYKRASFNKLIIAFDLLPKHNALLECCRKQEVELLLTALGANSRLPQILQTSANNLLAYYREVWQQTQRARSSESNAPIFPSRKRQSLELLVMEPMFEALPLADEAGFRRAIRIGRTPKEWPSFNLKGVKKPDHQILLRAFRLAPSRIRILADQNDKHQIAELILNRLPAASVAWKHDIVARLRRITHSAE